MPGRDLRGRGSAAIFVGTRQDIVNAKDDIVERGDGFVAYLARRIRQMLLVLPDFHSYNGVHVARDTRTALGL